MPFPPRDPNGAVVAHDDTSIGDGEGLLRKIAPDHHIVPDEAAATGFRLSLGVFSESSDPGGMSVNREHMIDAASLIEPGWGLVRIRAGLIRSKQHEEPPKSKQFKQSYQVGTDPDPHPSHACVWHRPKARPGRRIKIQHGEFDWVVMPDKLKPPQ